MTALQPNTGKRGATIQSWSEDNPRSLLKKLVDKHPRETKSSIYGRFREETEEDEGAIEVMRRYWFEANYRRLMAEPNDGKAKASADIINKIKTRARDMVLLDLALPSGRLLRDATGPECSRSGGWLVEVAKRVGAKKKVGDVLSEADLQKIWKAAK